MFKKNIHLYRQFFEEYLRYLDNVNPFLNYHDIFIGITNISKKIKIIRLKKAKSKKKEIKKNLRKNLYRRTRNEIISHVLSIKR